MAVASRQLVWSFHSQHCAAGLERHVGSVPSARFPASTGSGLDPVESTPMPITFAAEKSGLSAACVSAPRTLCSSPTR